MSHIDRLNSKITQHVSEESVVSQRLTRDLNDLITSTNDDSNPWSSTFSSSSPTTTTATSPPPPPRLNTIDLFEQEQQGQSTPNKNRKWESDFDAKACRVCDRKFGLLTRRRHHCRRCGLVVCDKCSSNKVFLNSSDILQDPEGSLESTTVLAAQQQRVCDNCFDDLLENQ